MKRLILQNLSIVAIKCARFHVKAAGLISPAARYHAEPFTSSLTHAPAIQRNYHPDADFFLV